MPLTDRQIRAIAPDTRTRRYFDGGGLYLEVTPAGGRYWRYKYRVAGREKRLALGVYPEVGLKLAREQHEEARRLVRQGDDPLLARRLRRAQAHTAATNSFRATADEWVERMRPTWAPSHAKTIEQRLSKDVLPWLGPQPIAEITAAQVLVLLRRIEERGATEVARRVRTLCSQVMRYAVATQRAERDVTADLRGALVAAAVTPMAAITDPQQIGGLLRDLDVYEGQFATRCALRLAPLVFVRPGELRAAEWTEFDLDAADWIVPAARLKLGVNAKQDARRSHLVPLATQAIAILRELHPLTGSGRFLFPGARSATRCMSNNTVNAALRRLGYDRHTMTGHGFRALASTRLNEMGFDPEIIERQLAHVERDKVRAAYNRAKHVEARRKMMQAWADYLDGLREGADVVAIGQRSK